MVKGFVGRNLHERLGRLEYFELAGVTMRQLDSCSEVLYCVMEGMGHEYTLSSERVKSEMGGFEPIPIRESVAGLVEYYKSNIDSVNYSELLLS